MIKWSEFKSAVDKAISESEHKNTDPEIEYIDFSYAEDESEINVFIGKDLERIVLVVS